MRTRRAVLLRESPAVGAQAVLMNCSLQEERGCSPLKGPGREEFIDKDTLRKEHTQSRCSHCPSSELCPGCSDIFTEKWCFTKFYDAENDK